MGYYTDFYLKVANTNSEENVSDEIYVNIIEDIEKISGGYLFDEGILSGAKWYDFDEHMIQISKKYPDITFQLAGMGEEKEDIWRNFYRDGKSYSTKAKIVFEPFDETLLK